jgi:hypothetical protein
MDDVQIYDGLLTDEEVLWLFDNPGSAIGAAAPAPLEAGDADMNYEFNQLDLVKVQVAAKYLSGTAATWGEGDWNGAPGGEPGHPPVGDSLFNQNDIIAALSAGKYLTGPYNAYGLDAETGGGGSGGADLVYLPEPSTCGLLGIALAAMLPVRLRRRR